MVERQTQPSSPWWQVILSLLALALLLVGLFLVLGAALRRFAGLDPTVGAALVTGSAALLVALASNIVARRYERNKAAEESLRPQKTEMYKNFIEFWFDMMQVGHDPTRKSGQRPPAFETR